MTYKVEEVGQKGEIVIGEELRRELGVGPGWRAYQFLGEGHLKIYFRPPDDGKPPGRKARQEPEEKRRARRGMGRSAQFRMEGKSGRKDGPQGANIVSRFLDTNVIIRYLTGDHPDMFEKAAQIIEEVEDLTITRRRTRRNCVCASVSLSEISFGK